MILIFSNENNSNNYILQINKIKYIEINSTYINNIQKIKIDVLIYLDDNSICKNGYIIDNEDKIPIINERIAKIFQKSQLDNILNFFHYVICG